VQAAAAAVQAGAAPGVNTVAKARNAAVEGAKRIMRCEGHELRTPVVEMLTRDIAPLMNQAAQPSVNDIFAFWCTAAGAGVCSAC
jgi:hypothetical protein